MLEVGRRLGERRGHRGIRFVEPLGASRHRVDQLLRVPEPAVFRLVFIPLPSVEPERFDFADLVRHELAFPGRCRLGAFTRRALLGETAPSGERFGGIARKRLASRVRIEERALVVAPQEQLMIVLAMDVDEAFPQLAQLRDGRRPAIDERARAPSQVHRPPQQACAIALVQVLRGEPFAHRGNGGDVEIGAHLGAGRAGAYNARIGAAAEGQRKRIDENRLAGARLAGERAEARRQLEIEPIDDDVVANGQGPQHALALPPTASRPLPLHGERSCQRSFSRSIEK